MSREKCVEHFCLRMQLWISSILVNFWSIANMFGMFVINFFYPGCSILRPLWASCVRQNSTFKMVFFFLNSHFLYIFIIKYVMLYIFSLFLATLFLAISPFLYFNFLLLQAKLAWCFSPLLLKQRFYTYSLHSSILIK